jgi:hypothetical protein
MPPAAKKAVAKKATPAPTPDPAASAPLDAPPVDDGGTVPAAAPVMATVADLAVSPDGAAAPTVPNDGYEPSGLDEFAPTTEPTATNEGQPPVNDPDNEGNETTTTEPTGIPPVAAPIDAPPPPPEPNGVEAAGPSASNAVPLIPFAGSMYVDGGGNPVNPDTMFTQPGPVPWVNTTVRINEVYTPAGMTTPLSRLVYPVGARVPLDKASAFINTVRAAHTPVTVDDE